MARRIFAARDGAKRCLGAAPALVDRFAGLTVDKWCQAIRARPVTDILAQVQQVGGDLRILRTQASCLIQQGNCASDFAARHQARQQCERLGILRIAGQDSLQAMARFIRLALVEQQEGFVIDGEG